MTKRGRLEGDLRSLQLTREDLSRAAGRVDTVSQREGISDEIVLTELLIEECVEQQLAAALWGLVDLMKEQSNTEGDNFQGRAWSYCAEHISYGLDSYSIHRWKA